MPRKISNGSLLAKLMLTKEFLALTPTARLVYVALLATTRRPYVDRSPFLISNLATLTGMTAITISETLRVLEAHDLFVRGSVPYSAAYYLPHAMAFDRANANNPNHRISVQKRLSTLRAFAPDLCDQFVAAHPEWTQRSPKAHSHDLESSAGRGPQADRPVA